MRESFVFDLLDKHRGRLLELIEGCPVEQRHVVPEGFNNSLHWQIGHILTVTDRILFGYSGLGVSLPPTYLAFFGNGTKPANWQDEPPAWADIVAHLTEQPGQIRERLADKLAITVKENFFKAETIGELIVNNIVHEVNHMGMISSMLKVLK